jgi:hypothetical protein
VRLVAARISAALDDIGAQGCLGFGYELLSTVCGPWCTMRECRVCGCVLQRAVRPVARLWTGGRVLVEADDAVEAAPGTAGGVDFPNRRSRPLQR